MLLLQVSLSPVPTDDVLPMKRLVGDGAINSATTRRTPHRTPDKTARTQNAADSWV